MVFQIRYEYSDKQRPMCLFDIECYITEEDVVELHCHTCVAGIMKYAYNVLLKQDDKVKENFVKDAEQIEELRGWLWEVYKAQNSKKTAKEQYSEVLDSLRVALNDFCDKYPGDIYVNED